MLSEQLAYILQKIEDPIGTLTLKTREKSEIQTNGLSGVDYIDKGKYLNEIKAASVRN